MKELTKLTNTPKVRLVNIPKKEWPNLVKLYEDQFWPIVIQIWNQYKVSEPLCNGCPGGINMVRKHIAILAKRYYEELALAEAQNQEPEAARTIESTPEEQPKKKRKSRKKKVANEDQSEETNNKEGDGTDILGAEKDL